ncbi:MAG: hypothetical protein HY236_10725 [Acidobacteria bacterium]|nr:hypothetical protein [Acidobacteriota bacterium]
MARQASVPRSFHGRPGLRSLTAAESRRVSQWLERLPYYRPLLRILAGEGLEERSRRLVVGAAHGNMHAASFVPHRLIVLDRELLARRGELARILYHEIFHFIWARLGAPLRQSYEQLLQKEWAAGARGELGWSAEERKMKLAAGQVRRRSRQWRNYVCESFCDSAAWFCLQDRGKHKEWTLKPRFRERRRRWFLAADILPRLQL